MPWRNAAAIAALVFLSAPRILLAAEPDQPAPFRWRKVTEVADAERVFPSAVDPNTVFVWSRGGLLVSKDDGHTFAARDKGLVQQLGAVTALLVNPIRPATLYAGTLAKGIFTSDDEGAAWRALGGVDQGLAGNRIHALVFSQDDPTFTTMFASHSMQQPGISMTIDGGKTWRVFAREYGVNDFILVGTRIFFAGAHPPGGGETGFYRSIDAGQYWYRILNVDLPTVLVASRASYKRAWCGTANGLFVTDNFGVSSRAVGPQATMNVASIGGGYGSPEAEQVYVYDPNSEGVLASGDGFKTWRKLNEGLYVGDWVAEGAMLAAAGCTLYACVNGTLYRGAAPGPARLSAIRAEPAAVVAGADATVFTCRAAPGAEIALDLSPVGGPAAFPLRDDGQSGDGAAGDGVFGARLEKVPLDVLAKARAGDYRGPALPGQVTLKVQARLGAASETGFALLTVLQPAANMKLWDGESHDALVTRGEGGVGIAVCQEHPFSGDTHLRVHVSGPGLAALGWHRHGVWPGSDDMRFHKLFTFCIRSNTPGPSELTLRLRDDGATYGFENARSSNQLSLSRYLPQLTTRYQRVAIPMADFVWGSAVGPERIRELEFIAPAAETRLYDIDDVGLAAKPGPILSDCEAALAPDGSSVRVSVRATSTAGALKSAKASCEGKEFELYDDGRHGDGESGDGCYANIIPLAQVGTGTRTFHFVATDAEGTTDDTAAAFLPRRPPGQIARARSGVKIDGDLAEFADATPFAVGDDKLGLRARLLYEKNCLYVGVEVKDAAYNPQPPKKGQRKPPPEKLAESGSAELVITSPTAATCLARTSAADDDHRFVFVMDEQQAFALRGNQRLPAAGKKTEGGYLIEAQIPFDLLRSRRGQCDFERGKHTRIEWRLIGADGRKLVWNAADAEASANPENWGLARFTDEAGTPKLRYTRTDGKVLTLVSSKRLKADAAQRASSYDIPGLRVENVTLENDGRTVRITASAPLKIGDALKVRFNGLQSEDGFPTEPELAFSPLPGRPLNGELLQEFLIGEVRRDVDMQSVTKAHIDETTKPVRGPQWGLATAEGGIFNLNQLAGGFNNALVHAHAYLHADKERAVQVWVGSDDGVRVVVNGAPVFTVPVSRGCIPDQDKIKDVKLKAGWNSLLLAVWNGSGEWSLCARIMDENGNPPQGVSYQADSPFAAPPAGVTAPPPSDETFSAASTADVTVEKTDFMGWKGACRISNKACELVVVPQISRVLHFSPKGGQNLLWINGALAGKTVPSDDRQWHNFGGDKVWPTAQTLWQKYTGRAGWPPPYPFDCGVGTVEPIPSGVRLTTPKDPQFGAVCVREFVMDAQRPLVQVRQRYEKSDGAPAEMTLWTITQVRKPEFALLPLGKEDQGKQYRKLQSLIEPLFASHKTVLSLRNDEAQGQKVGVVPGAGFRDGWVAAVFPNVMLVQSRRLEQAGAYPDGGCHGELFAADRSLGHYMEIELLSPLRELKPGEKLVSNQVWQLVPCTGAQAADPEQAAAAAREAHKAALEILGKE